MIDCHEAVGRLWEYLDHSLAEVDQEHVEEHLALCRRCCAEMDFAHELRRLLAHGADLDVPADVLEKLNRTVEELDG